LDEDCVVVGAQRSVLGSPPSATLFTDGEGLSDDVV